MGRRAVIFFFFASFLTFCLLSSAQETPASQGPRTQQSQSMANPMRHFNSISGSVRGSDDKPLSDVHVELRDGRTGQVVNSAYTGMGGDFEFTEIPQGTYRVVAFSGTQQAEERVEVSSWNSLVTLRLPSRKADDDDGRKVVSVASYRVPEKAREELRKAREASTKGRTDEAQTRVAKALEIHPEYADALTFRAILKLTTKDTDGAVTDLQKAIQCDGNYAMAYMVLGSAFNIESKYDEAIRALERGESLEPDAWQAYFELGKAYAGKADFKSSLGQLNRALTLAPQGYPLIRLVRAHVLMQLGQYSDAVIDLQTYLEKNPNGQDSDLAKKMLERATVSPDAQK
jgi:Tfp pilus assembly protein PilF